MRWPFSDLTLSQFQRLATSGRWDLVHRAASMAIDARKRRAMPVEAPVRPAVEPEAPEWESRPWEEDEPGEPLPGLEPDPFNPEDFPEEWDLPTPKLRYKRDI